MSPIEQLILKMLKRSNHEQTYTATVISVDKPKKTCVIREGSDTGMDRTARLVPVNDTEDNVLVIYPVVGSLVTCTILNNDPMQIEVIAYTQVDEWLMNGGANGPIIVYSKLLEEYNKTRELLDAIADSLIEWVPAPGDGGTALKTLLTEALAGKASGDFEADGFVNPKMKH